MKLLKATLSFGFLTLLIAAPAQATVIVTYAEKPGIEASTFIHATTYDFNSLSTGLNKSVDWSGVGTFDQLYILKADQYGGADNTQYSVQGINSPVSKTILNLDTASSYFGLWWSAGDASNVMDFYSGANGTGTLMAEFTTASLLKALGKSYDGNPNPGPYYGKDAGEPFAFINFFATPGTSWSSIVLTNSSSSGFESDNYASRVAVYDASTDGAMPGIVLEALNGKNVVALVPEPNGTLAMVLIGGMSVGGSLLRRFQKKS
ncbi:MAG: hypothetical protein WCH57_08145 [Verrucomicrobiota bacterium]